MTKVVRNQHRPESEREPPEDDEEQPKRKRRGRRGGRRRKRRGNEDGVNISAQDNVEATMFEETGAEQLDTPADNNINDSASQPLKKKQRSRAKPKEIKANMAADTAESEADTAQIVGEATLPEQGQENDKKQAAKKKTKAKKKVRSDTTNKTKAKEKDNSKSKDKKNKDEGNHTCSNPQKRSKT